MLAYEGPIAAFRFALFELLDYEERIATLPRFAEASRDLVEAVLAEAAKIASEVLLPLNRPGDEAGCRFVDGRVELPEGFAEAYRLFADGGWCGVTISPEYDGQGLPQVLQLALMEMVSSANMAFGITPGLTQGAAHALELWGSEEQKRRCLPMLASGRWAGTMCLTEPQAGTDLGLVRCRATPAEEGRYRLTGEKIFVSAGEHRLTENILHLVLARLPDAPTGTRGISLFLVPKFLITEAGGTGRRNGVLCTGIEEKMGIHASPTCTLRFEDAVGELVGEAHGGMKAMFAMMNEARLGVGIQGLAIAETAFQSARAYAAERLQGRAPSGPKHPGMPADPILLHPDVRRMLFEIRARTEAARMLALETGIRLDLARYHPDPEERAQAEDFAALATPVIKAHFTDFGFEAAVLAQQVLGGHGYIREHGLEQLVRDVRITQIYEGTNGIQALDLVGRKMGRGTGRLLRRFCHPLAAFLARHRGDPALHDMQPALEKAFSRLQRASLTIAQRGLADPEEAAAVASDYLRLFGTTALAWMWARAVVRLAEAPELAREMPSLAAYPGLARYYFDRILPETGTLFARITSGKRAVVTDAI